MKKPIVIGDQELFITASIGIATNLCDDSTGTDIFKHADAAMYKAKE